MGGKQGLLPEGISASLREVGFDPGCKEWAGC